MKRILAALVLALGSLVVAPSPAEAHPVSGTTTYNVCQYIRPPGWSLWYRRHIHYGGDLIQCEYYSVPPSQGGSARCRQYWWNSAIPAGWDEYTPTDPFEPVCW